MNTETDKELIIRKSGPEELEDLVAFYRRIIDQLHKRNSVVKWSMEVYPTRQDIASALKAGEMHAGTLGGRIVCAFRLGGNDETYDRFDWPTEVPPGEVSVIHLLAVDDDFAGRGFAARLVAYSADLCRKAGKNTGNQEQDRKKPFHRQSSFPQETRRFRMQEFYFPVM